MNHRYSLYSTFAALLALIAMAIVAGCGGKGKNPSSLPVVPAEQIVAKMTSPTATVTSIASATTESYTTLGFSNPASPLNGFPTDAFLANTLATLQHVQNQGGTPDVTVGAVATKFGKSPATFAAKLNAFVSANYNGSNSYLKSLARLIVASTDPASATAPTITEATVLQSFQGYYVATWAATPYAALDRSDADCFDAIVWRLSGYFFQLMLDTFRSFMEPTSIALTETVIATCYQNADHYQELCHAQG